MLFLYGVPENFNSWGERRSSEYLLLKQSFGTCTRREPATKSLQNYNFFLNYANISPKNFVFSCFFFFLSTTSCISYLAMKARTIVSVAFLRPFMALVLLAGLIPRAFPLRSLPPSSVSRCKDSSFPPTISRHQKNDNFSTWSPAGFNGCSMDAERVLNGCMSQPEHPFITLLFRSLFYRSPLFQRQTHMMPHEIAKSSLNRLIIFPCLPLCLVILSLPYSPPFRVM